MTRDQVRQAALEQLRQDDPERRGSGQLAAAIGRVTLAYDLWTMRRRDAAAEQLVDSLLDAVQIIHQGPGGEA